jgi:pantothenate kinase
VTRALMPPDELLIVGMDGWHYPNAILDVRTTRDENGSPIPLRRRKGGPESYDIESLRRALEQLKDQAASVSLPVYDRRLHEPRPAALSITPATRIVIVEGNYVLGGVESVPEWNAVAALLHPKLLVECEPALARERMLARHQRGGSTPQEASARYEHNDRLNTDIIAKTAAHADYWIKINPPSLMPRPLA